EVGQGIPLGGLRRALAHALRDPSLELAFPAPEGDGYVDADGRTYLLPDDTSRRAVSRLESNGSLLAVLVHDPEIEAEDPGLVTVSAPSRDWRSRTSGSAPRFGRSWKKSGRLGPGSSRRGMPSAGGSNVTSTTGRSSGWSRSQCAWSWRAT